MYILRSKARQRQQRFLAGHRHNLEVSRRGRCCYVKPKLRTPIFRLLGDTHGRRTCRVDDDTVPVSPNARAFSSQVIFRLLCRSCTRQQLLLIDFACDQRHTLQYVFVRFDCQWNIILLVDHRQQIPPLSLVLLDIYSSSSRIAPFTGISRRSVLDPPWFLTTGGPRWQLTADHNEWPNRAR